VPVLVVRKSLNQSQIYYCPICLQARVQCILPTWKCWEFIHSVIPYPHNSLKKFANRTYTTRYSPVFLFISERMIYYSTWFIIINPPSYFEALVPRYPIDILLFLVLFLVLICVNPDKQPRVTIYSTSGHRFLRWTVEFVCVNFTSLLD